MPGDGKATEISFGTPRHRLKSAGYRILSPRFYPRSPGKVARALLGKYLLRQLGDRFLIGRIVETEAYYGASDPASHAYRGMTPRNKVMFGVGGKAYIYLAYGNHYLLNIVTGEEGTPGAVLIRAVEPVAGIEETARRRESDARRSTNGPGRLTRAFAIHAGLNGCDVSDSLLLICRRIGEARPAVAVSQRIGIRRGRQLDDRYYIPGNSFVSGKPKL
jgi:DNA-3-methyladenine glycosylase